MSQVRMFKVPTRMAREIKRGRGMMAVDAMKQADLLLAGMRVQCERALDEELVAIALEYGPEADRSKATHEGLYKRASNLLDVLSGVPGAGLAEAIGSFCSLVDACWETDCWYWQGIDIHLNVIGLLRARGASMPTAERERLVRGLSRLTAHVIERLREGHASGADPAS